jgi:hypothetical protein
VIWLENADPEQHGDPLTYKEMNEGSFSEVETFYRGIREADSSKDLGIVS